MLDGTVGQNAVQQGKLFAQAVSPTGIVVTKLDGSARGGAVAALRRELDLPIRFLGVGEAARRPAAVRPRAIRGTPAGRHARRRVLASHHRDTEDTRGA